MSGPCPHCHTVIQGPNQPTSPPQPQPLNPPKEDTEPLPTPHPSPEPSSAPPLIEKTPVVIEPARPQQAALPTPLENSSPEASDAYLAPEPDEAPRHPLQSKHTYKSGLSLLQAFILCFLSSLIFFVLGFFLGKSGSANWEDLIKQSEEQKAALPPRDQGDGTGSPNNNSSTQIPITPLETSPPTETEELTTASATLEAFLTADTWGARNAYVLNSKSVLSMMAANATIHGDGPIPFNKVTLEHEEPNVRAFSIKTDKYSSPFTVMMLKEGDWWLVDWPGFADFYHDRLTSFASGREGPMKGIFRVLLKAAPGETSPLSPSRCLVSAPQSSTPLQVNSVAESPARRRLAEIFQAYLQGEPEKFKKAMAEEGIPLTVEISRSGAQNPTLQLEQVIATGWPPLPSKQFEKDPSSRFY